MDIVKEFEELKPILQEKWLKFYSDNKDVIYKYLCDHHHSRNWSSSSIKKYSVLAILITLEPKLSITINNYIELCKYLKIEHPTINNLLDILEIAGDINSLDKQIKEKNQKKISQEKSLLDDFRPKKEEFNNTS